MIPCKFPASSLNKNQTNYVEQLAGESLGLIEGRFNEHHRILQDKSLMELSSANAHNVLLEKRERVRLHVIPLNIYMGSTPLIGKNSNHTKGQQFRS